MQKGRRVIRRNLYSGLSVSPTSGTSTSRSPTSALASSLPGSSGNSSSDSKLSPFLRPKGAALIQALSIYKFPRLCSGDTSPVTVSIRHPKAAPIRDSKPMSEQRLRLRRALWTSATCMAMDFGADASRPSSEWTRPWPPRTPFLAATALTG